MLLVYVGLYYIKLLVEIIYFYCSSIVNHFKMILIKFILFFSSILYLFFLFYCIPILNFKITIYNLLILFVTLFIPICLLFNVKISGSKNEHYFYLLILLTIEILMSFIFFKPEALICYLVLEIISVLIYLFYLINNNLKFMSLNLLILLCLLVCLFFL